MKALYARQSIDKKDSLSVEGQIELCKTKISKNDSFEEYTDRGYSGKNTDRPQLNKLMKDIESGKIDCVIVYRLDRFSRNITDFYNMYEVMKAHSCEFVSVSESFDTSTPMGRAMMGILVTFAQMERENIQQRVKDNYYYRIAQDGRWAGGPAPYGFRNAKTTDGNPTLEKNEEQIKVVKLIFRLYADEVSISLGKIAKILRERGIKNNKGGDAWDSSMISKILQSTIYVKADEILYKYLQIRQIKFLNDISAWNGEHSAHIVGKRVGNANIRKYTNFKEQSVYITNFAGIVDSRTYICVMNRLEKNEQLSNTTKSSVLQELGGKLKCSCGYAIKAYSKSTNGRPYLDCYANRSLHICKHKYNKFNFYDIQAEVGKEIQLRLDILQGIVKLKIDARLKKENQIKELEKQLENLVVLASKSDLLEQATIARIEQVQSQINKLQLDLKINYDIIDSFEIPSFGIRPTMDGNCSSIIYSERTLEEKKYIVNLLIEKIVLCEETGKIDFFWKLSED